MAERPKTGETIDTVLAACRALVAVSAKSIAAVADVADPVEVRVLVVVCSRGTASLREVADGVGMHVSTASRLCDRMVSKGLLDRENDPDDRRQLALTASSAGADVVRTMMRRRRSALQKILERMTDDGRALLTTALGEFADAAGESREEDLWSLGWTA
jgi:DNA-binding MarR family transcriptional regulator